MARDGAEDAAAADTDIPVENLTGGDTAGGYDAADAGGGGDNGGDGTASAGGDDRDAGSGDDRDAGPPPPISQLLEAEKARSSQYEQRLKLALADYQNLSRRTASEIETRVTAELGAFLYELLAVRDDFVRARDTYAKADAPTDGLDSVLKNMDAILDRRGVRPIDALGEIFDPHIHEAISTEVDATLDESTVTREVRKGFMLKNTIIRPSMVVISKRE